MLCYHRSTWGCTKPFLDTGFLWDAASAECCSETSSSLCFNVFQNVSSSSWRGFIRQLDEKLMSFDEIHVHPRGQNVVSTPSTTAQSPISQLLLLLLSCKTPGWGQSLSPSPWVLATPSIPTNTDLPALSLQGSTDLLHARSNTQLNPPNLQQACWHLFYSCSLFLSIWEWRGDRRERCGVGSGATKRGGRDEPPPFSSMPLEFQSPPRFFCRKLLRWGEFPMLGIQQRCGCTVWFGFFFCLCVRFPL